MDVETFDICLKQKICCFFFIILTLFFLHFFQPSQASPIKIIDLIFYFKHLRCSPLDAHRD